MNPLPDFSSYFRALWGYDPFPWQCRLADLLARPRLDDAAENEDWPAWLTLPTGTGKTSAIDIAIYDLARQAANPDSDRRAPVRIVFAVNRRIVVDEAFERARSISSKLALSCGYREKGEVLEDDQIDDSRMAILRPFAEALRRLSGIHDGPPLEAFPLRGGTFTDHSWARTPTQPLVLTTTLDQLGSRLLFRGYGVSPNARPIHAALLANDSLLILDEAHTARAFSQTLASVSEFRNSAGESLRLPFAAVQLTATPPQDADVENKFSLDESDHENAEIRKRLAAPKPAELTEAEGAKGAARHKKLAEMMGGKAIGFLDAGNRRVLVVVNRVATAEAIHDKLTKLKKDHGLEVEILTGRIRPLDREDLVKRLAKRYQLKSNSPASDVPPLILVATQCIEVGADFDFDALVTELAPLDSLRQRFGRLNRNGREIPAPAAIVAPDEVLQDGHDDPLYGKCLPSVWKWLGENRNADERIDFGLDAISGILPTGVALDGMLAPALDSPILLEPHLDLFCQTSPEPHISPDPALYIHGPGRNFPEVSVILRADLEGVANPAELLKAIPPLGSEAATVPLHHLRKWLVKPTPAADDGGDTPGEIAKSTGSYGKVAFPGGWIWRNGEARPLGHTKDLAPGDMLVLAIPNDKVGLAEFAKNLEGLFRAPDGNAWDLDQFESAHLLSRDRLALRFHRGIRAELERLLDDGLLNDFRMLTDNLFATDEAEHKWQFDRNLWEAVIPKLSQFLATNLPAHHPWSRLWKHATALGKGWKSLPYPTGTLDGVIFRNSSRIGFTAWPLDPADLGKQGDRASVAIPLAEHSRAVEQRAIANSSALPAPLAATIRDAAAWHDLGKLDPRFQAMLQGSAMWAVETKSPLAKSGPRTPADRELFAARSGLPKGFRHELVSALIVDSSIAGENRPERDLLLHLIASHHGRCRAMAPAVRDDQPERIDAEVDGEKIEFPGSDYPLAAMADGVTRRFWELNRRFGWWGLPYLEALLRLADQYASANPDHPTS